MISKWKTHSYFYYYIYSTMAFIYVTLIEFLFVHHFFLKHGVCTKSFNTANCTKVSNNGGRRKRSKRLGGHEMNLYGYVNYTNIST